MFVGNRSGNLFPPGFIQCSGLGHIKFLLNAQRAKDGGVSKVKTNYYGDDKCWDNWAISSQ